VLILSISTTRATPQYWLLTQILDGWSLSIFLLPLVPSNFLLHDLLLRDRLKDSNGFALSVVKLI
jgi:hypothetical protein